MNTNPPLNEVGTPETDKNVINATSPDCEVVTAHFARQLERRAILAESRLAVDAAIERCAAEIEQIAIARHGHDKYGYGNALRALKQVKV